MESSKIYGIKLNEEWLKLYFRRQAPENVVFRVATKGDWETRL